MPENYVVAVEITMIIFRRKVITTSGIRPLSWSFWVKKASGEVGMYTSENLAPKNIGIDTEIASISVSVAKLIVLPVWDIVSTSGLHMPSREVSTRATGLTANENICGTPNPKYD